MHAGSSRDISSESSFSPSFELYKEAIKTREDSSKGKQKVSISLLMFKLHGGFCPLLITSYYDQCKYIVAIC